VLTYQGNNHGAERGIGASQGGEEVIVLGMVMLVEQHRVGVQSP
jgi:hypothetical protein